MDGFPIEQTTLDGFSAIRRVVLPWSDVDAYISHLATSDGLYPYDTASGATLFRAKIEKLPGSALSASGGSGYVTYQKARVTLWYSTDAPRYYGGLFYTEAVEPFREFNTLNNVDADGNQLMKWVTTNTDVEEPQGVIMGGHTYVLTYHRATSIPANFFAAQGYCNSASVTCYSLGKTYAAQTLLHDSPYAKRQVILGGANRWMLRYRWIHRAAGWNKKYNPATNTWDNIKIGSTTVTFQPTVNFATLVP
jgi:hypothetical protein